MVIGASHASPAVARRFTRQSRISPTRQFITAARLCITLDADEDALRRYLSRQNKNAAMLFGKLFRVLDRFQLSENVQV